MATIFANFYLVLVNLLIQCQAAQLHSSGTHEQQNKQRGKQVNDLLHVFGIQPATSDPQVAGRSAQDPKLPSIVDMPGHLPPVPISVLQAKQNLSRGINIAICSTGHLRTFSLPGMYSSLSNHLLRTAPGVVDLFLVGHLGAFRGNGNAQYYLQMDGPTTTDDGQFTQALAHLKLNGTDRVEDTSGDCKALEESWKRDGITGRSCNGNGYYMQMMWLDHCIHRVRNSGRHYDFLVRTRPDVGIFQPFPWDTISMDHVTYMTKDGGAKADWFFVVPWSLIKTWWDPNAKAYAEGYTDGLPDYTIFGNSSMLVERHLPVVMVRGKRAAQCWRLVTAPELQDDCVYKTYNGFWEELHS